MASLDAFTLQNSSPLLHHKRLEAFAFAGCLLSATAVARVTGYSAYWVGQIARRYNRLGPDGIRDRRHTAQLHRHLQRQQNLVCSATLFPWWPRRIGKRKGPRKTSYEPR